MSNNHQETGAESAPAFDSPQGESSPASAVKAHQQAADSWPLEADRLAIQDPLVDTLRILAGYYGRRTSRASLTAGLPIPAGGITPNLFTRAAERTGLHARLAEKTLEALAIAPNLPCILVLEGKQACILWEVREPGQNKKSAKGDKDRKVHPETQFLVQFPETEDEKQLLGLSELKKLYTEYAFYIRPVARTDERAGPAEIETAKEWFWSAIWENRNIYGEVVLAAVMINIFAIISSLFVMNVYDRVIPNNAYETLWVLSVGVLTVYVFDFLLKNMRAHFLDYAGKKADIKISARLFQQMMGMTMESRPASAGVMASHMREFESLRDFFTSATMTALIDLPFVLLFILLIAIVGGPLAFVPFVAVPLVIGIGMFMQKPLERVTKQSMMESALKNALLFETIAGLETIKVQAAEGHTQRTWEELTEKSSKTSAKSKQINALALNLAVFVQQVASVAVVIVGVYLIANAKLSMGALVACVILTGRAMAPLAQVAGLLTRLHQSKEGLHQLNELMKRPVERPAGKHFISMPSVRGKVEFQDVLFHYPGQAVPALNGVNFVINEGEHVGVIGAVGSGKTTLERLLINLYQPESGSVQLDGIDVRQIDPGDLRRNVGAVQQSPQLFYGSVRTNITMGHETAPDRAVLRAAELAGVTEFLRDSKAGLDTQVGERGESLSGGQRQAVAIARALLYDPPVLILDEPTASMDPASENRLMKRLEVVTKDRTTILITHKGSMLSLVSKIILIDRGRIIAYGPKDEIIRKLQARQYGTAAEDTDV
ncbi:MAG: type I secretion system permease/ATPase [Micavibrio aeruginosavorus]|uniref:Type I secretion system permease/ATPase n=1 Tax=Micavibrio aeruginosavorus TaxID=349221 RepID=A0A2W5QB63_9BACT|nr:MAG: type I secretion system permease/ATPase [Micavibrio aeruginosavorus]